jgi:hypothetical protein
MVTPSRPSGARERRRPHEPTARPTGSARLVVLLVTLALGTAGACASDGPTAVPAPVPTSPPQVGVDGSFARVSPSVWAEGTRYVFADDGTFRLDYPLPWRISYLGRYTRADSVVALSFYGTGFYVSGASRGVLRGDTLSVTYDETMRRDGLEDGAYVRAPRTP